ncbi:MAG: glycoside hydrolase family 2 protein, partial [Anaerolineales bacterium]|nr:glycoside hydrolase family 2 protein [Anaerolineales bacterium]
MAGVSHAIAGGPYLRKAPSQFGWDWGPKLPPIGIWKEIRLEAGPGPRFDEVHLRQHHENGAVTITAGVTVADAAGRSLTTRLTLTSPAGNSTTVEAAVRDDRGQLVTPVTAPQLWWPNGLGEQPLYRI